MERFKLGIVGAGVLGQAVRASAECAITVLVDRDDPISSLLGMDAICVCVGTPPMPSGECDTRSLEDVMLALRHYEQPIVCHSTAPPAFYKRHARSNVVHVPEFVRGAFAAEDYRAQTRMIIGGELHIARTVFELWRRWLCPHLSDCVTMSEQSAALAKYIANALLAVKVGLLNEVKPLADQVGASWQDITDALALDPRLGTSHWQVPGPDGQLGFGGTCFPKDMRALIAQLDEALLLRAALAANAFFRQTKSQQCAGSLLEA